MKLSVRILLSVVTTHVCLTHIVWLCVYTEQVGKHMQKILVYLSVGICGGHYVGRVIISGNSETGLLSRR